MKRLANLTVGLLTILGTAPILFYYFAWATLAGGELPMGETSWWVAVLAYLFNGPQKG